MPKNDNTKQVASAKSSEHGFKSNRFDKNKERAYIARTGFKQSSKALNTSVSYLCPITKKKFANKTAYELHRKAYDNKNGASCGQTDWTNPGYLPIEEIRGDKYKPFTAKRLRENHAGTQPVHYQKYMSVLVDEETGKTEMRYVTVKKYRNFRDFLEDDGETIIASETDDVQYIDPDEQNLEGDDREIVDY